jgi:elongation factor P
MKVTAITLRAGHVIDYNGKLWVVVSNQIIQPGKGASVSQVEMRDVRSGAKDNVRFRTQETVERVRLDQDEYQYLYTDGDEVHFMHTENFNQIHVSRELIGPRAAFLQEGMVIEIETYEGEPLGFEFPDSCVLEIVEAEPVVKGQTATTSYKPAILENGVKIMVPPHVGSGTKVVIRIEDGTYIERFKG